jgi:hypothetical protein
MTAGSGTRLKRTSTRSAATAIAAVVASTIARRPRTKTAPAMAPVAAAVTPSTKALIAGIRESRRKCGAGITVNR